MARPQINLLIVIFLLFLYKPGFSQTNDKLGNRFGNNWLIGATFGPTFFSGDLNSNRLLPNSGDLRGAGSVFFGRQMSQVFTLRGQFLFGKSAGTKPFANDGTPVNLHFDATLLEGTINTMINLSNLIGGVNPKRHFFVYGTIGIGGTGWNTKKFNTATNEPIPIEGSIWKASAVIPAGIGVYYSIANKVNLGLEWTYRTLTSDLLDETKGGFPLDIYEYLSFGVTINLNKGSRKTPDVMDYKKDGPLILNLPKCDPKPFPVVADQITEMAKLPLPPSLPSRTDENYTYKIQIFAFSKTIYSAETIRKRYHIPMDVSREYENGLYRFIVGATTNLNEAREIRNRMIGVGIRDAFIVAYKEGERMPFMQNLQD